MSQPERDTLDAVEKLLAERRKVAGWQSALDARRSETSPAVYQRVHDDYSLKLEKVQAKLVAASDAVQAAATDVAGRLLEKEKVLATRQDERAEAELRAAVGEYSEREWEKRRARLDDDVAAAIGERDTLREELSRLRRVLGEVAGAAAPEAEQSAKDYGLVDAAEQYLAVGGVSEDTVESYASSLDAPAASPPAEAPLPAIEIQEQSPIASVEKAVSLEPTFDELAFLKTVVGRRTPLESQKPSVDAAPPSATHEPPRTSGSSFEVPEPPLEYPDPVPEPRVSQEMTPPRESFFGRPTPRSSEAVKSLKCQECGTLNFPTEWYCERCGGELAAL